MHNPLIPLYAASLMAVLFAAGCAVNPVTGEKELSLISERQEISLGENNYGPSRQSQGGDYYLDSELQAYITSVGRRLAAQSDRPDLPYEFVVLNNSVPNAWALPGGKIAINRGLLEYLDDESQLAAVLAHEIVHAAARHSASQMSRGTLANIGMLAVAVGTQGRDNGQLYAAASQLGTAAWMAKYGRDDELESDYYGMEYMARAGYEPQGAVELQRTFVKLSEDRQTDFISGLFASHPPSIRRVEANSARASSLPSGQRYRQRYQAAIAQLKKDAPAYAAQKTALAALDKKQSKKALAALDKAVAIQPEESAFWELRGQAWKQMDNLANADRAFTTAISKNPQYFSPYLARGVLRHERGETTQGLTDIKRSYALLPTPTASYYLGEEAMEGEQYSLAAKYYKQAYQAGGELQLRAKQQLQAIALELEPQRFITAQLLLSDRRELLVRTSNSSPVTMQAVRLRITVAGQASYLTLPAPLAAGQTLTLGTGIGPIVDPSSQYQVEVTAAAVLR